MQVHRLLEQHDLGYPLHFGKPLGWNLYNILRETELYHVEAFHSLFDSSKVHRVSK